MKMGLYLKDWKNAWKAELIYMKSSHKKDFSEWRISEGFYEGIK
jgi:hypothetical protein